MSTQTQVEGRALRPWQMTREQLRSAAPSPGVAHLLLSGHRVQVVSALMEGKAVPPAVLAEYPGAEEEARQSLEELAENKRRMAERMAEDAAIEARRQEERAREARDRLRKHRETIARVEAAAAVRWQRTKADYVGKARGQTRELLEYEHRTSVEDALREGKPVPAEVLADYPELASTAEGGVVARGKTP